MNSERHKFSKNVNEKEINKFDNLSSYWWNDHGNFKLLHYMNVLRLKYIKEKSNGLFGKKVLDVGCGGGILSEAMAKEGAIVTGIDMSIKSIKEANSHALDNSLNINYLYQTIEEHSQYFFRHYDIITCMEVLEHIPYPSSVILHCDKLIKFNGNIFFSTINRNFKSWFITILCAEYILSIIPQNTHNIKNFIRPSELLSWIDDTSLCIKDIVGICYNPFTHKFYLGKNIDVNYMIHISALSD